jgi:hypothetical protein
MSARRRCSSMVAISARMVLSAVVGRIGSSVIRVMRLRFSWLSFRPLSARGLCLPPLEPGMQVTAA